MREVFFCLAAVAEQELPFPQRACGAAFDMDRLGILVGKSEIG